MRSKPQEIEAADLLVAQAELLHSLMAFMVLSNMMTADNMKRIAEVAAHRLERARHDKSASALRFAFASAFEGEWEHMRMMFQRRAN
jgi:hypothetical protein